MGKNYIIDNSFQLIRTNPKLTSNIKILVDSEYKIYLESFNSNKQLNNDKYKHYQITKDSYYEDKIPVFYDGLPINLAFEVKYDNDQNIMYNNYIEQFDNIYFSGAKKIEDNQFFNEEFEYFAPLYIRKGKMPSGFIILRVDDPASYTKKSVDYDISKTDRNNFREEIINKWKCINVFDFSYQSDIGYWMDRNFVNNDRFPEAPLEIDFKKYNYSRWYGIDYNTGVYTEKSVYLDDKFYYEQPHFRLDSYITDNYRDNSLLFPNILNFKFLFDDTPASPFELKKYSINRYLGFYADKMNLVKSVTPYKQTKLKQNIKIEKNIFYDYSGNTIMPFDITKWDDSIDYYINTGNNLYKVIKVYENNSYTYKIISDVDVLISNINSENEIDINFTGNIDNYYTELSPRDIDNFSIDSFIDEEGYVEMYSDLYLIDINGKYHVLESKENENGTISYYIRTDYGIRCNSKELKYWIVNENIDEYKTIVNVESEDKPLMFNVYKIKFCDIKDFDFDRINTGFADFDFDKENEYVNTPEQKLYTTDFLDNNVTKKYKEYPIGNIYENKTMIVSSEYIASDELYEINKKGLTDIWRKNQSDNKWGFMGSISHSDYPYKLNNSKKVGGEYNRTVNTRISIPNPIEKTNNYFYRIGDVVSGETIHHYKTQTLTIETETYKESLFNLKTYIDSDVDYFDYFFKNTKINENGGIELKTKYSVISNGTNYNPSITLFNGIKYNIRNIKSVIRDEDNQIINIITDKSKNYNNYKFSVIINNGILDTEILSNVNCIHIFMNEKYKNVLIILNTSYELSKLNNLFDSESIIQNIYDNEIITNPEIFTAYNFMNAINELNDLSNFDNYVTYHYIDANGKYGKTDTSSEYPLKPYSMSNIESWGKDFPPFIIDTESADEIITKRKSFSKSAIKGPKYNIYDKYKKNFYEIPYDKSFIKVPLATKIDINEKDINPIPQRHGETQEYINKIYRFSGPYEPIFKDIELFEPSKYNVFNTNVFNSKKSANIVTSISESDNVYWNFRNKLIGNCDENYCFCELSSSKETKYSEKLYISNFDFNLPLDIEIKRIDITIRRKADRNDDYIFVRDNIIQLMSNGEPIGDNLGLLTNITDNSEIVNNFTTYSSQMWQSLVRDDVYSIETIDQSIFNSVVINNENFGLIIQAQMYNDKNKFGLNSAYVDCVNINVQYIVNDIETGKTYTVNLERNYKFDTSLEKFGIIDELQYSKVNEKEIVLKIRSTEEDKSIYPMIDEYGYSYDSRFIFKSSWDSDFNIRTKNSIIDKDER